MSAPAQHLTVRQAAFIDVGAMLVAGAAVWVSIARCAFNALVVEKVISSRRPVLAAAAEPSPGHAVGSSSDETPLVVPGQQPSRARWRGEVILPGAWRPTRSVEVAGTC